MAVIINGVTSGQGAEVDATAKALRVTQYDINGNSIGPRYTFDAATNAFAPPATPTDVLVIGGSVTKTIKVTRIRLSSTATQTGVFTWYLLKRSTADSAGTAIAATPIQRDTNSPAATATVNYYTANPTVGTLTGIVRSGKLFTPNPSGSSNDTIIWDFDDYQSTPIYLRGTAQQLAISFSGSALPVGLSVNASVTWTEE